MQSPYVAMPRSIPHEDRAIAACQSWIADNYRVDKPVARMIDLSGLGRSTFRRRFLEATGYTPIDYVHAVRIEEAKQLLETAGAALEAIAEEVGYEDESSFRKLFKRMTGITPTEHRRQFGTERFSAVEKRLECGGSAGAGESVDPGFQPSAPIRCEERPKPRILSL